MQTFSELEKKLLNKHAEEFKNFSKLILTLASGILAFTLSLQKNIAIHGFEYLLSISMSGFFLSLFFGVLVQHQIMLNPLKTLNKAKKLQSVAEGNKSDLPILVDQKPSLQQRVFYKLQIIIFVLSFLPFLIGAFYSFLL